MPINNVTHQARGDFQIEDFFTRACFAGAVVSVDSLDCVTTAVSLVSVTEAVSVAGAGDFFFLIICGIQIAMVGIVKTNHATSEYFQSPKHSASGREMPAPTAAKIHIPEV